jgi:hypothetical protein
MSNVVNEGKALSDEPRAEDSLSPVDAYDVQPPPPPNQHALEAEVDVDAHMDTEQDEDDVDRCSICLNDFHDRAVLPTCSHEFCFECITIWTGSCTSWSYIKYFIPSFSNILLIFCRAKPKVPSLYSPSRRAHRPPYSWTPRFPALLPAPSPYQPSSTIDNHCTNFGSLFIPIRQA